MAGPIKLFGFTIGGKDVVKQQPREQASIALPTESMDDGAVTITQNAYYGTYVDLEGAVRNELELITRYREMANHPELDQAIDDIVNESITHDVTGRTVDIVLDKLKQPEGVKKKIAEEFENVLKMLNFSNLADDLFKRWYIDGRIYYQVVVDENKPKEGIQELRYIDPRKIRKVREIQKERDPKTGAQIIKSIAEYYVYNDRGTTTQTYTAQVNQGVRIAPDAIINVNSGLMDAKNTFVISYLHKAIKPLNQLRMIEDAVVIYRLSRAPERRVFYIDVGNLPKGKAEQYLRDIMIKYRNKMVYDASTGELRDDRKHLCLAMNTKVPLLDGRILTIEEIAKEHNEGKKLWAYSCDPITGAFVPGLITWAGVTRPNAPVMKITLDNGKHIICTPEHSFPVWNKGFVEAKNLIVGESMIPHYTKQKDLKTPYLQIYQNDMKQWEFVHRLVSKWKDQYNIDNEFIFNEKYLSEKKTTVHHKNFKKLDNTPENLIDEWKNINSNKVISKKQKDFSKVTCGDIQRMAKHLGEISFNEYKQSLQFRNHKIVNIEFLEETMDTGCLTIDGEEQFHNYHTFALDAGIYTKNSMLEDFWLPRREGGKGTEITTLPAGQNLGELEDVKYFQKKLLQALNVPLSRLEPQQGGMIGLGRTTEVTREEVKFNKFIVRLRNKFSQIFDNALGIQLALKGVCTKEEWQEFKEDIYYAYKKDNNFTELRDAELLRERVNLLATVDPFLGRYYSNRWVKKNILQMTDEQIEEMEEEIEEEQKQGNGGPAMQQGQEPPPSPDEYPPVDNTIDDASVESDTPDLDRQTNKFSSILNR